MRAIFPRLKKNNDLQGFIFLPLGKNFFENHLVQRKFFRCCAITQPL
jgi:hypothetical protein